jgi:hypothetical protein
MMDFSWIIIILIIFGMISSVVKRMKNSAPPPERRPRPVPVKVEDRADMENELRKTERSSRQTDFGDTEEENTIGPSVPYLSTENEDPDEMKNMIFYAEESNEPYARETVHPYRRKTARSYQVNDKKTGSNPFKHLTKEQLRDGILLSEVLRSPRAKRPHPAARRHCRHIKG